jgi:hypothetical protein
MGPVDVDRPEWAQRYAVGDEIAFRIGGDIETAPVAGFSSLDEYRGQPVIVIPDRLAYLFDDEVGTAAIPESRHIPPEDR